MQRARTTIAFSVLLAAMVLQALPARADTTPDEPPSPQAFYAQALSAMRQLPEPPYVTYRLEGQGDGLQIALTTISGQVWLQIGAGSMPSSWLLRHRTDDYTTEIYDAWADRRLVTQRSFFDPTWYGSYRALRDGMLGYQDVEAPVSAQPTAPPDRATTLKTIAVETVMGPGIYAVEDRGSVTCANGDPGHALHLVPRTPDPRRQLTEVVVDTRSMRFCSIRYAWRGQGGFRGEVEQHYADVGGYWMQTDGLLDGSMRALGIVVHHGIWRYRFVGMQFPPSLPDGIFAANPYQ
jgi:hypothetical protein